jgi:hypothetical protein
MMLSACHVACFPSGTQATSVPVQHCLCRGGRWGGPGGEAGILRRERTEGNCLDGGHVQCIFRGGFTFSGLNGTADPPLPVAVASVSGQLRDAEIDSDPSPLIGYGKYCFEVVTQTDHRRPRRSRTRLELRTMFAVSGPARSSRSPPTHPTSLRILIAVARSLYPGAHARPLFEHPHLDYLTHPLHTCPRFSGPGVP